MTGDPFEERILDGERLDEDIRIEASLRPRRLEEFVGQDKVKATSPCSSRCEEARAGGGPHSALRASGAGQDDTGEHRRQRLECPSVHRGPAIERPETSRPSSRIWSRAACFHRRVHRLSRVVEEILYPALEDRQLDLHHRQGPAPAHEAAPAEFTVIGATTPQAC